MASRFFSSWVLALFASTLTISLHAGPVILEHEVRNAGSKDAEITLLVRLPGFIKDGNLVKGVLAFCTWESDINKIRKQMEEGSGGLLDFAEAHQLAYMQWNCIGHWNREKSADELSRKEESFTDAEFDRLARAWDRGVGEMARKYNLPQQDFLLAGISRGAQWAHRLALRKPNRFLAIHVHVNSSYDRPTIEAKRCLWLITTGELEHGYPAAKRFYADCISMGYPMIFKAGENLGHSGSPEIDRLGEEVFEYALAKKTALDPKKNSVPTWEDVRKPEFLGDYVNQVVYPIAKSKMIPPNQQVPLPTKEIAEAWGEVME